MYRVHQNNPRVLKKGLGIWDEICTDISVTPDLPLELELRIVSQDDWIVYTVLSYVWVKTENPKEIIVDGCASSVTENLGVGLQHLQYDDIQPVI